MEYYLCSLNIRFRSLEVAFCSLEILFQYTWPYIKGHVNNKM